MHLRLLSTLLLIALFTVPTGASAQKIYRCGNTYSQQACPDGQVMPAVPPPDAARKGEVDQATRRDAVTADRMEKSRLQQEKKDLAANTPVVKPSASKAPEVTKHASSHKKSLSTTKKEEFRAVVPGTTSTKKQSKKKTVSTADS
jgi:hypothetical protein